MFELCMGQRRKLPGGILQNGYPKPALTIATAAFNLHLSKSTKIKAGDRLPYIKGI